jgi:hypothetical protein
MRALLGILFCVLATLAWAAHNETPVNPSASILGGIESIAATTNQWIDSISTSGVPHQSQPGFSNLSGSQTCAQRPALTGDVTAPSGSCTTTFANAPNGSTINDAILKPFVVSTSELDASNNTLATVSGLTITLAAGKTYNCHGHLSTTSSATAGLKVAINAAGGSLTATSSSFTAIAFNAATVDSNVTSTALGNLTNSALVVTDVLLDGAIVVNAGGTINVQAAQSVTTSGSSNTAKVFINSTFSCVRVN